MLYSITEVIFNIRRKKNETDGTRTLILCFIVLYNNYSVIGINTFNKENDKLIVQTRKQR